MKIEGSYVISDKRFRDYRAYIFTDTYAAGRDATIELSRLPAGEYLVGVYFLVEGVADQDGNGGDAIDHTELVDVLDLVQITNGSNTHLRMNMIGVAQLLKLSTGQNPIMPNDIAASTGASVVHNKFAYMVPFYYSQWQFKRPHDFAYPTTLIQDGNLSIHWTANLTPGGHASNSWSSATLKVICLTKRLNRATIPPEPECNYLDNSDATITLHRGNYNRVWVGEIAIATFAAFTTITAQADGMVVVAPVDYDHLCNVMALDFDYRDDETQIYWTDQAAALDKNIPVHPNTATVTHYFYPVIGGCYITKIAELLRVENNLVIDIGGTAHAKRVYWQKFYDHTESGLDARAKVMGFGSGSRGVPRTHRRALTGADLHLANILPVRMITTTANLQK